jgi:hypothetical protein
MEALDHLLQEMSSMLILDDLECNGKEGYLGYLWDFWLEVVEDHEFFFFSCY